MVNQLRRSLEPSRTRSLVRLEQLLGAARRLANETGSAAFTVNQVVDAAFAQARQLSHLRSNFDSVPLLLLGKAMTDAAPGDLKRIGFTLHGSLAVEMAMKLALLNRPRLVIGSRAARR